MHSFLVWLEQIGIGLGVAAAFVAAVYGMALFSQWAADQPPRRKR